MNFRLISFHYLLFFVNGLLPQFKTLTSVQRPGFGIASVKIRENVCLKTKFCIPSRIHRSSELSASPFSLDHSVLPPQSKGIQTALTLCLVTLVLSLLVSLLGSGILEKGFAKIGFRFKNFFRFLKLDFIPLVKLGTRIFYAKSSAVFESAMNMLSRIFDLNPAEELDIKDWKACILEDREAMPGGYIKYKFELLKSNAIIPLYMGQEVRG